jgi:hypothetical protein
MCWTCRQERGSRGDDAANALRLEILLRDGFACYGCGSHDTPQVAHLAHPPDGRVWNLATACRACLRSPDGQATAARRYVLMCTYLTFGWKWIDLADREVLCAQALQASTQRNDKRYSFARFAHFRESIGAASYLSVPPPWAVLMADADTADVR